MTNVFKLKRKYIIGLGNWLGSIPLNGRESRARTKFVALLEEALARHEKDRKMALEEICEKNEDGSAKLEEENGTKHYVIPDDKKEEFEKEMQDLGEQEAELTGPETAPTFVTVSNIILNYDGKIDGTIAYAYDKWCEAAESYLAGDKK